MTAPVLERGAADVAAPGSEQMLELLRQTGESDPRLQLIAQLLQSRAAEESRRTEPADTTLSRLERRLARLHEAHLALRDQYLRLADALGACPRCWGEDARCRDCGGRGTSGWFAPDGELFVHYVLPAVRRMREQTAGAGARTTAREVRADEAESQPEG